MSLSRMLLPVEQPSRLYLLHPATKRPLVNRDTGDRAWVDLLSADSEALKRHNSRIVDRAVRQQKQGQARSVEDIEADHVDRLVVLTKGWSLVDPEGEPIDDACTPENARTLYSAPGAAWVRDQVEAFVNDRANFTKGSSTS